jgi:hypothetical protein
MQLRRKLRTIARMPWRERGLVAEAALMLALARLVVLTVPFRFVASWLRRAPETAICDQRLTRAVGVAVTIAARNVPWNAVCLPQAMAAKIMLARRGCGSALHLGLGFGSDGKMIAHAWLVAGGRIVVGTAGMSGITALSRFG